MSVKIKNREIADPNVLEPGEYLIKMEIDTDRRGFYVELRSSIEMSDDEIILALEEWLYDNILEGYRPEVDTQ